MDIKRAPILDMVLTSHRSPSFLHSQSLQLGVFAEWPKRSPPVSAVGQFPRFGWGSLNHPVRWGEDSSGLKVEVSLWEWDAGQQEVAGSSSLQIQSSSDMVVAVVQKAHRGINFRLRSNFTRLPHSLISRRQHSWADE